MIYVDYTHVTPPSSLEDAGQIGDLERIAAITHFSSGSTEKFKFKAYKSLDAKQLLESLFHNKCAYCEVNYGPATPVDVEHFRPKGAVQEDKNHPGYWWLASRWRNLLPSCLECNRRRRKFTYDFETGELSTKEISSGKKDSFPILGVRAYMEADDHSGESPLLINPTFERPEEHLTWIVDKHLGVVSPKRDANNAASPYGATSISIYGLNRQRLVESRMKLMLSLQKHLADVRYELAKAAKSKDDDYIQERLERAKEFMSRLHAAKHAKEEYSAMASAFVEAYIHELANEFQRLSKFN